MSDGYRDYGPNVSQSPQPVSSGGAFSGDDRSYESVLIQADAPVIDWEMNLRSQVGSDYGLRQAGQRLSTSCFLGGDFLERSDPSGSFTYLSATVGNENRVILLSDSALINGWHLRVEFSSTSTAGQNLIVLPTPPLLGTRTDLVIMEVWRALIRAAPSVANKSPTGLILRNGNVKCPDAVPNLTDDLIDPNFGAESNARIQIQYRLRVISGVDLDAYMDGIDDPTVVANSVSDFTGPGADGSPTAYTYSVVSDDKGLWRAGTGDAAGAAALGTADGFMYAVPVFAVRRRNQDPFSRTTNMNGGSLIVSGTSTRPDGLFSDQVVASDVADLRRGCGVSFEEVLEKAYQQVLDNSMSTRSIVSDLGTVGTTFLYRDDVGDAASAPSGTTDNPGNPDGVRRYFSDRPITDTIVFAIQPFSNSFGVDISDVPSTNPAGSAAVPWNMGATVSVLQNAPEGTSILEVLRIRMNDGGSEVDLFDPFNASGVFVLSISYGDGVDGVNTTVSVQLNAAAFGTIYLEMAVTYPSGSGLTRNILESYEFWAAPAGVPIWVDQTGWTASPSDGTRNLVPQAPITAFDGSQWWVDLAHRELALRHRTTVQSYNAFTQAFPSSSPASITGANQDATVDTTVNNVLLVRTSPLSAFSSITVASSATLPKANPSITGTDVAATVNTTVNNTLRVRTDPSAGFSIIAVTSGAAVAKTTIRNDINAAAVSGLTASVNGTNQLILTSSTGYVEVDSVANGSTLNTPVGFPVGGQVSTSIIGELNLNTVLNLTAINAIAVLVGTNQIRIESGTSYIELDSVANGSTLNTPLGFSAAGEVFGPDFVMIPERLTGDPVTITSAGDPSSPYATTDYTVNTAYTLIRLQRPILPSTPVQVDYVAYRPAGPLVSSADAYNLFYRSRAMQSLPVPAGTQTLRLTPRAIGRVVSVIVTGPGSPDDSFPFTAPGDQVPIGLLPSPDYPESNLDGPADVYLADFNINTGFMQLTPFIPYVPNTGEVTLFKDAGDATLDAEGRSFWPKSFNVLDPPVYSPAIYAQELYFGRRHKVVLPVLMELKEDFDGVGRQGMLVLVVLASWIEFDPDCRIVLLPTAGDSCAGVFRVRGNMMSPRRPRY